MDALVQRQSAGINKADSDNQRPVQYIQSLRTHLRTTQTLASKQHAAM